MPTTSSDLYIDGRFSPSVSGDTRAATSPGSGETIAEVAWGDTEDAARAVDAARRAARGWARTLPIERAALCERVVEQIQANRQELIRMLSLDQGKPLAEAADEVAELITYFRMAAADAVAPQGFVPHTTDASRAGLVQRVPLGVVGIVTPWNWPYTMAAELLAPALAAGNTVVWVPAPTTAACSVLLARLIAEAEPPPGVFNFVPGDGPVVGNAVVSNRQVSAVGFIGSVATGARIAAAASGKVQLLELGGNGPMVILEDADLDLVVPAILESAFLCAGQSCTAGERFLVHRGLHDALTERLVGAVEAEIRLGDPFAESTTMGPVNNPGVAEKMDRHVGDALAKGAKALTGGERSRAEATDLYWPPTVLDAVNAGMEVAIEETFGPVVPLITFDTEAEALAALSDGPHGLLASIFTDDLAHGLALADQTESGWVNINLSTNVWESHLPFGGRSGTASGIGRVGGRFAMEAFSEPKTILYKTWSR